VIFPLTFHLDLADTADSNKKNGAVFFQFTTVSEFA
jgi:hypothetical protein